MFRPIRFDGGTFGRFGNEGDTADNEHDAHPALNIDVFIQNEFAQECCDYIGRCDAGHNVAEVGPTEERKLRKRVDKTDEGSRKNKGA